MKFSVWTGVLDAGAIVAKVSPEQVRMLAMTAAVMGKVLEEAPPDSDVGRMWRATQAMDSAEDNGDGCPCGRGHGRSVF